MHCPQRGAELRVGYEAVINHALRDCARAKGCWYGRSSSNLSFIDDQTCNSAFAALMRSQASSSVESPRNGVLGRSHIADEASHLILPVTRS